jgi:hypothetical protein
MNRYVYSTTNLVKWWLGIFIALMLGSLYVETVGGEAALKYVAWPIWGAEIGFFVLRSAVRTMVARVQR